jgi:hypothetical protein
MLTATKYWRQQNIGCDKILVATEMFASTEIIGVNKMLALIKSSHRQNPRVDKSSRRQNVGIDEILALTKYSRRQNSQSTKCWRRRRIISFLFGSAESTAADFSQTSLMISYVSQKVLIPPHAVAKCGIASGRPAFMGGLSLALLYRPAMQKMSQILASTKYWRPQDFTDFPQTIAVYIFAQRHPAKNW